MVPVHRLRPHPYPEVRTASTTHACGEKARFPSLMRNRMDGLVDAMLQGSPQQITLNAKARLAGVLA
jgi:hypothetical protein